MATIFYRHWEKFVLSLTALFWASCQNETSVLAYEKIPESNNPKSSSSDNQQPNSSSSIFVQQSSSGTFVENPSSSDIAQKGTYTLASDPTVSCSRETKIPEGEYMAKTLYNCDNGLSFDFSEVKERQNILYTPEEADKAFGPCVEHGGRVKTESLYKITDIEKWNTINEELEDAKNSLRNTYYEKIYTVFRQKEEKKEPQEIQRCLSDFYHSIEPVCAYGVFSVQQNSEPQKPQGFYIEKVTCKDGAIINEDEYNYVAKKNAEVKASQDQIIADEMYCLNKKIYDLIDSCNSANKSETPVPVEPPDTTNVSKELLHSSNTSCDDYDTSFDY